MDGGGPGCLREETSEYMVMATRNRKPNNVARFRFRFCRYRAIAGQQQTPFVENK